MMQCKIGSTAAAFLAAAALACPAAAQQTPAPAAAPTPNAYKIGFVSTERVMRDARVAQQARKSIEAEFEKREQEIVATEARLKRVAAELEKSGGAVSAAERQKRVAEASKLQADLLRRRNEFAEELNLRREEVLKGIVDKANAIIRRIAEQENFDLVFFEAAYAATRIDLTDRVIKALDAAK
jgi:outer membrane protein